MDEHRVQSLRRLAVLGWDAAARDALAALEATGGFAGVAVGDHSGAALVRARRETGLPCFQRVDEMLRHAEYDALLLASDDDMAHASTVAASRGAALLVLADHADSEALEAAAGAASVHETPFALLRPALHEPGVPDLLSMIDRNPDWAPQFLDVTVEGPLDTEWLLRRGVSYVVAIAGHIAGSVQAASWGTPRRSATAAVQAGGRQIVLRARHAPDALTRITGDSPAGAFEVRVDAERALVAITSSNGERMRYEPDARDPWTAEATRVAAGTSADDLEAMRGAAALLDAVERSAASGDAQETACCRRPALRLIEGGGQPALGRTRHLTVVGS